MCHMCRTGPRGRVYKPFKAACASVLTPWGLERRIYSCSRAAAMIEHRVSSALVVWYLIHSLYSQNLLNSLTQKW